MSGSISPIHHLIQLSKHSVKNRKHQNQIQFNSINSIKRSVIEPISGLRVKGPLNLIRLKMNELTCGEEQRNGHVCLFVKQKGRGQKYNNNNNKQNNLLGVMLLNCFFFKILINEL